MFVGRGRNGLKLFYAQAVREFHSEESHRSPAMHESRKAKSRQAELCLMSVYSFALPEYRLFRMVSQPRESLKKKLNVGTERKVS